MLAERNYCLSTHHLLSWRAEKQDWRLWHVEADDKFRLQSIWSNLSDCISYFKSPSETLHDLDVAATMACSLADDATALAMLLIITSPDVALTAVDPSDVDRVAFLEDWTTAFFEVMSSLKWFVVVVVVWRKRREVERSDLACQKFVNVNFMPK